MFNITKASIKFQWPSWVVYDKKFRMEAANTPTMDWSKVDPSINSQCGTGGYVVLPTTSELKAAEVYDGGMEFERADIQHITVDGKR